MVFLFDNFLAKMQRCKGFFISDVTKWRENKNVNSQKQLILLCCIYLIEIGKLNKQRTGTPFCFAGFHLGHFFKTLIASLPVP